MASVNFRSFTECTNLEYTYLYKNNIKSIHKYENKLELMFPIH